MIEVENLQDVKSYMKKLIKDRIDDIMKEKDEDDYIKDSAIEKFCNDFIEDYTDEVSEDMDEYDVVTNHIEDIEEFVDEWCPDHEYKMCTELDILNDLGMSYKDFM